MTQFANSSPQNASFEGSYLGATDKISALAIMECKICWTTYDPAEGDDTRQISEGTAFRDLPDDWSCPGCSAPAAQFLVREDPGSAQMQLEAEIDRRTTALVADFTDIWHSKMKDVPIVNHAIHVQAVGFTPWNGGALGVLIAPWFMNLVFLPGEQQSKKNPMEKEVITFPSGRYEFIHNSRPLIGPYMACSLFSPMNDFTSQLQAVDVAKAVMIELFNPENEAETDRSADIRRIREAEIQAEKEIEEAAEETLDAKSDKDSHSTKATAESSDTDGTQKLSEQPTRRKVITGGIAE